MKQKQSQSLLKSLASLPLVSLIGPQSASKVLFETKRPRHITNLAQRARAGFGLGFLVLFASISAAAPVYAAGGSISLTANKATVSAGGSVVIAVYMNGGGTPINAVETDLTYPAGQLQYVGINYSGSAFSINAPNNGGGNGTVTIGDGTTSPISGSGLVATVTFTALVNSGSASIGVAGSSSLVSANDNSAVPYGSSGASVKFGAAAAAPATSSSAVATTKAVTPTPTPIPAPPKDVTPPVISDIKVASKTPYSAVISWTTNEPSDSAVDYGLDANYGLSVSAPMLTTSHSVTLNSTFLTPKTTFHYRTKSTDGAGNVQTGTDQTLALPGVPVTVIVRGADGKPQAGAQVSLGAQTTTTGTNGQANFQAALGNTQITTSFNGVTIQKPVTVGRTIKPLPPVQLDLSKTPLNRWMLISIGLGVAVLTLLAIDAFLFGSSFLTKLVRYRQPRILTAVLADADKTDDAADQARSPTAHAHTTPLADVTAVSAKQAEPAAGEAHITPSRLKVPVVPPFGGRMPAGASPSISQLVDDQAVEEPSYHISIPVSAPTFAPNVDDDGQPLPKVVTDLAITASAHLLKPTAPTTAPKLMGEVTAPPVTKTPTQINVSAEAAAAEPASKAKAASVAKRLKPRTKPTVRKSPK